MSELLPAGANAAVRATEADIELEAVPGEDTVSGDPRQGIAELGPIGDCEAGIWELREGVTTDTEVDELFVVLSGRATVVFEDPALPDLEVGPGSVVRLAEGMRTTWTVTETLRKVYIA